MTIPQPSRIWRISVATVALIVVAVVVMSYVVQVVAA